MRSKVSAALGVFLLVLMISSLAVARDWGFDMNGVEINPGTTTKNCLPSGGGTYTTTGITFVGSTTGDARGTWVISLDATGALDGSCEPIRCDETSHVTVTGGTWLLKIFLGTVGGSITDGSLLYRPDGPVVGECVADPVPGELVIDVDLALGRFRGVHNAEMDNVSLDHSTFPPRVKAGLTLIH